MRLSSTLQLYTSRCPQTRQTQVIGSCAQWVSELVKHGSKRVLKLLNLLVVFPVTIICAVMHKSTSYLT